MVVASNPYRWVIVAAGGLIGCVAMGAMFSLPVFLLPISQDTGWSVTGISSAMTFGFLAMAAGNLVWGSLSDRIGPRPVVMGGAVFLVLALAAVSRAPSLPVFQLLYGLGIGAAVATSFVPLMACVTGWFDTQRGLAVSLVSAGMGMAPMTMSPLAAWLVTAYDWRTAMLIIAGLVGAVAVPASFLIRRPPVLSAPSASATADRPETDQTEKGPSVRKVVTSVPFAVLVATNFFCCATHSGPLFHTVSYAVTCGIPMILAVSIYSLEGLAGMGGRVGFGFLSDRFGARHILVFGLAAQSLTVLSYGFVSTLGGFYTVAAIFGFIYAGTMPLYAVLARENFPLRMMGTVIGSTAMAGALGMATGPVTGGLIYDHFGSYVGLYVGSAAIGLMAVLLALTFRARAKAV